MDILRTFLIVVEAVISLLLIGIILLQRSKGEGLGLAFGAGMGETLFGSRAGNVLTRATVVLGTAFVVNTLVLAILFARREASLVDRGLRDDPPAPPVAEQPFDIEPIAAPEPEAAAPDDTP